MKIIPESALPFLNENATEKDLQRVRDLFTKSKGNDDKLLQLTQNMANSIDNPVKALSRAYAAEKLLGKEDNPLADIFYKRYNELTNQNGDKPKNETLTDEELNILANLKVSGVMYLPTVSAAAIFENEIKGQLSDGAWENARPYDHWKIWSDIKCKIGSPKTIFINNRPIKTSYNLHSLIQYVDDRMIATGKLATNFSIEEINTEKFKTLCSIAEYGIHSIEKINYVKSKFESLNMSVEEVESIISSGNYTLKDLRKDLTYIKEAMKNYTVKYI